jgi:hypothetical protein
MDKNVLSDAGVRVARFNAGTWQFQEQRSRRFK